MIRNLGGSLPFFWLHADTDGSAGAEWFRGRLLKSVLDAARDQDEALVATRKHLAFVDFHAYRSARWSPLPVTLPSQHFTFDLVRRRVAAGALVVVTRAWPFWAAAVPELLEAERNRLVVRTKNPQQVRLSNTNLERGGWTKLMEHLGLS